jgi:hypothetical protein
VNRPNDADFGVEPETGERDGGVWVGSDLAVGMGEKGRKGEC